MFYMLNACSAFSNVFQFEDFMFWWIRTGSEG
jgi:hypothetical protein